VINILPEANFAKKSEIFDFEIGDLSPSEKYYTGGFQIFLRRSFTGRHTNGHGE
jgi:hypothetical protein